MPTFYVVHEDTPNTDRMIGGFIGTYENCKVHVKEVLEEDPTITLFISRVDSYEVISREVNYKERRVYTFPPAEENSNE